MKQYKVIAASITTHLGVVLKEGEIVNENRFKDEHISDLIKSEAILPVTTETLDDE